MTYKRRYWLEEAIHYFLKQTYKGKKELIILNDEPAVEYIYEHPEIKIYNWKYRFKERYQKHNMINDLCKNELIFPWADDDIYESWTLEVLIKYLGDKRFIAPQPFWKEAIVNQEKNKRLIKVPTACMHIVRRDFLDEIGPIPDDRQREYWIANQARKLGLYEECELKPNEIYATWRTWSKKHYPYEINPEICHLEPGIRRELLC